MSNLGLDATIYRATKKYTDLLDTYLILKKSKEGLPSPDLEKNIKEFFAQLNNRDVLRPEIQIIASIMERACRERKANSRTLIERIVQGLESDSSTASVIKELERVAMILSSESSFVLSRMQDYAP